MQTVVASLLTFYPDPQSYRRYVHFSDGERIALEVTTPPNWKPEDPTIVMVHGFCGPDVSTQTERNTETQTERNTKT